MIKKELEKKIETLEESLNEFKELVASLECEPELTHYKDSHGDYIPAYDIEKDIYDILLAQIGDPQKINIVLWEEINVGLLVKEDLPHFSIEELLTLLLNEENYDGRIESLFYAVWNHLTPKESYILIHRYIEVFELDSKLFI